MELLDSIAHLTNTLALEYDILKSKIKNKNYDVIWICENKDIQNELNKREMYVLFYLFHS